MNSKSVRLLSFLFTFFIASLIIFKLNYSNIIHLMNAFLMMNFFFIVFITKEYVYSTNSIITMYTLFIIYAMASSFWGIGFTEPSFKSLQLFLLVINLFITYNIMKKFNMYNAFLNGILLGSFVNYIFVLHIIPAPFPIMDPLGHRYFGTLGNANVLSMVMLVSILSSIIYLRKENEINKIFYSYQYINILLAVYMIFLTVSKKGIFSGLLIITIFLLLTMKSPKHILKLIFFIGMGVTFLLYYADIDTLLSVANRIVRRFTEAENQLSSGTQFGSTGERLHFIKLGWDHFTENPLFGHGLNNFRLLDGTGTYSHNNYIELLFGVGLIGITIFYSIYYFLFKKINEMKDNDLKIIFLTYVLIIIMMGMAQVQYGSKITFYIIIFLAAYAEHDSCKNTKVI